MKQLIYVFFLATVGNALFAQGQTFDSNAESDPEATLILDGIKAKYDAYEVATYNFNIDIEIPGQAVESPDGRYVQKGEKFVLYFGDQEIYNDNETLWIYDSSLNIVQLYDANFDEEGSFMSPAEFLEIYKSDDYTYAIINEWYEGQTLMKHIDFKPLDEDSEFFKVRLELKGKNNDINLIKVFAKDGSRYTLRIKDIESSESIGDDYFVFDASKYEDIQIENLRID